MTERSSASGGTGLPASIEAAWGLRDRPVKGPKPGLTLDRIVAAAVEVAAAEGLSAVSMGRVAKELGASTMSLYRYVSAKEELYVLMQEAVMGVPEPLPALEEGAGWREAISQWAWAQRRMFGRHLWSLRIPIGGPPASPHMVLWWEQGLQALAGSGLSPGDKISVILLISGFVRNEATLMSDISATVERKGISAEEFMARWERTVRRLVDPVRNPELASLLDTGVMSEPGDPDYEFVFGLARILDGVEALIEKGAPS
ncbi:TetR/AcrR family transcriptional regulator [Streptomyces sp. QL37]|uniref:TetR/AcrR family transcriptional regulator n=1 Tax=Streptomyces sp. QL37 TaxID=2093747 RepID=UPI000CF1F5AA|nr:TetR/AcrR family transcriptional regulator [Streptomyces sp. QL37]PPQ58819.1 TetR family transcriptional regulator [Streptomyces sp. QL37]